MFPDTSTLLLAQIHRVNRTLRNLLCDSRNPTDPAIEGRSFKNVHKIHVKAFSSLFIVILCARTIQFNVLKAVYLFFLGTEGHQPSPTDSEESASF